MAPPESPDLAAAQLAFERARERVWIERIGAGLAYRRAIREIDEQVAATRMERDQSVRAAVAAGGSYRAVGRAMGLSHSRIQQIVNSGGN